MIDVCNRTLSAASRTLQLLSVGDPEVPLRSTPGVLFHDGKRDAFEPGDVMFVAAELNTASRTLPRTSPYGLSFTGRQVERSRPKAF